MAFHHSFRISMAAALLLCACPSACTGAPPAARQANVGGAGGGAAVTTEGGLAGVAGVFLPGLGGTGGSATGPGPTCDDEHSTVGCSFFSVRPPGGAPARFSDNRVAVEGACFAAFVVNVSSEPVALEVEYRGVALDVQRLARAPKGRGASLVYEPLPDGKLPPQEVAILFLTHRRSSPLKCPSDVGFDAEGTVAELRSTGLGSAFVIRSSGPVAAYDIFPFGGGASEITSATLLLPTRTWGTSYWGVSAYKPTEGSPPAVLQLVASEDETEITVVPTADLRPGDAMPSSLRGTPRTYSLNSGQVLQLAAAGADELSGSPIRANKPVGVWASSACSFIEQGPCDSVHQQLPPVQTLGHEYVAVKHPDRFEGYPEEPPWRFWGIVDGTQLSYDPAPPAGAPTTLDAGQVAQFNATDAFHVASQDPDHPFYAAGYMTGCLTPSPNQMPSGSSAPAKDIDCRGDPEFVNLVPTTQYIDSYVFFTDPTYPETSLVVTRKAGPDGFADVSLDCAGAVSGWRPVTDGGTYEYAYVPLVSGNFEGQGSCQNGRHEISSKAPIGVTIWGWGSAKTGPANSATQSQAVSYAYPAGSALRAVNDVELPVVK